MNRLISAEWYRARKCSRLLLWTFVLIALFVYLGFYESGIMEDQLTVVQGFGGFVGPISACFVYVSLIIAANLAISYENKVLHYDMMAGNKISHIILSKIIVLAPLITLFMTLCTGVVAIYVASKNGSGDMKILLSYFGVFTCINFRIITVTLLIMTIFKGTIGALFVFVRVTLLDMIPMVILMMLMEEGHDVGNFAKMIPSMQYNFLDGKPLESSFVILVIVSMVVEITIMYVLSYISHKKKLFY